MPTYRYLARDERGNAISGTLAALSPEALADQLKRMGYVITKAEEQAGGRTSSALLERLRRISYDDLVLFNVQLSKMIRVGIPLVTALDTLVQQTDHPRFRQIIQEVARNVEAGSSFSKALGRHPAIFSELFINMVSAGEMSGKLDEILRRLANFAKHQAELRQQLKTAMTYPFVLLVVGCAAAAFLLIHIIPKFIKLFLEAGVPLPLPTYLLYQLSQLLRHYWLVALGLLLATGWGLRSYVRTPQGRRWFDTGLLRIPVIGDLARKAALARLARTFETLCSSGVPILESLAITELTCGNTVIADACRAAQVSVKQGGSISDPLRVNPEIPPMVVQMIAVGEVSGALDHMLGEIAEHYDDLIQHGLKRLTTLIEPLFLILMGGLAAFIMASILLPLFRMVKVVR